MGGSFNTREFFHGATAALVRVGQVGFSDRGVRRCRVALLAAGVAARHPALLLVAFVVQYAGLLAERWFFFAQAQPSAESLLPGDLVRPARLAARESR